MERINEGQITRESVEEILSFGNAAKLCPKEFVAEKLSKLRILKAVGIQRAMVGVCRSLWRLEGFVRKRVGLNTWRLILRDSLFLIAR